MESWSKRKVKPPFTSTEILGTSIRLGRWRKRTSQYCCGQKYFDQVKQEEEQLLVSLPTRATGNKMPERVQSFDLLACKIQLTQPCGKRISNNLLQQGKSTKIDQMETTDGEQLLFCAANIQFSILSESPSFGSYSWRHNYWTSSGSSHKEPFLPVRGNGRSFMHIH